MCIVAITCRMYELDSDGVLFLKDDWRADLLETKIRILQELKTAEVYYIPHFTRRGGLVALNTLQHPVEDSLNYQEKHYQNFLLKNPKKKKNVQLLQGLESSFAIPMACLAAPVILLYTDISSKLTARLLKSGYRKC